MRARPKLCAVAIGRQVHKRYEAIEEPMLGVASGGFEVIQLRIRMRSLWWCTFVTDNGATRFLLYPSAPHELL